MNAIKCPTTGEVVEVDGQPGLWMVVRLVETCDGTVAQLRPIQPPTPLRVPVSKIRPAS